MSAQVLPFRLTYVTGGSVYAVRHGLVGGVEKVWNPTLNSGAGGWEDFNGSHWAQYAIALTEQGDSAYYSAPAPAATAGVFTWDVFYNNASPTLGDAPISSVQHTQGDASAAVNGDPAAAANLQQALSSEILGALTGTPTAQVLPTNLSTTQAAAAVGRALAMTSGVAVNCAGRVIGASGSTLTLAAPLAATPAAADAFIIL